jgi:acetyl esterase/lipase
MICRLMPSLTARLIRVVIRRSIKPKSISDRFVEQIRKATDGRPPPSMLGRQVERRPIAVGEYGRASGEWVGVAAARRHILYLHGGYYLAGRPGTYRNLAGRLASGLRAEVLLVEYRLAPEHPYPAALDDAIDAYRGLLDTGVDPATVAVAGDSAGGGLALALLQRARSEALPLPGAAVLFSPWVDLTCSGGSVDTNDETDDMLSAAALRTAAALYAGHIDLNTPGSSPLFGDLSGLPPLFITVDSSETLLDDSLRLVDRCRAVGAKAELHQTTGLFHVWPITVPYVREARQTLAAVVSFLDHELA